MTRPRAFTLLELLVATALSTVLMIGVLAVVADLGAPEVAAGIRDEAGAGGAAEASDAWVRLLREDLAHAHSIDASKANEVALMGYGALDGRGRERTHRPVLVLYRIEMIDGRPWLIRRQAVLDVLTNQNVQRDLVCCGVTRFELVGVGGTAGSREIRVFSAGATGTPRGTASEGGSDTENDGQTEPGPGAEAGAGADPSGRTARETSARPRESGIEGVEFPADGPEGQVRIRGNWIFIELVPWVLEGRSEDEGSEGADAGAGEAERPAGRARRRESPSGAGSAGGDRGSSLGGLGGSAGGQQATYRRAVGTVWRLRLWTDNAAQPTRERIVMVETSGQI